MNIRSMTQRDAPAVGALAKVLGAELNKMAALERIELVVRRHDSLAIVAEADDGVVGFLHAYERLAFEKPVEAVVQAIAVRADRRGAGIGSALMQAAEDWARRRGLRSVALYTRNASEFYASRGYEPVSVPTLMRKQI